MSIRISESGRLFGILAALGGAAMSGSAGLSWTQAVFVSHDYLRYDISELRSADRRAVLMLGLFVIVGAACFTALGSRRMRMTAGALVVLAAAAGLVIALRAGSLTGWPPEFPCTHPGPCLKNVADSGGRVLAGLGAVLAAGYGIVALLRSGGQAPLIPVGRGFLIGARVTAILAGLMFMLAIVNFFRELQSECFCPFPPDQTPYLAYVLEELLVSGVLVAITIVLARQYLRRRPSRPWSRLP